MCQCCIDLNQSDIAVKYSQNANIAAEIDVVNLFSKWEIWNLLDVFQWLAGWFLGAYFLGGFSEDGRGMNGLPKGLIATAKSWAVGIPVS